MTTPDREQAFVMKAQILTWVATICLATAFGLSGLDLLLRGSVWWPFPVLVSFVMFWAGATAAAHSGTPAPVSTNEVGD